MTGDLTFRDDVLDDQHLKSDSEDQQKSARTVRESDSRLSFRGTLFQPWCHVMSRRNA